MSEVLHADRVAPVALGEVSLADAKRRLKQSFEKGDQVRPGPVEGSWFVSSESKPGMWHLTRLDFCDCKGHQLRGLCRHRVRVSWENHQASK